MKILAQVDFADLTTFDIKNALTVILDELKFRGDTPDDESVRTFSQIIWKDQMTSVLEFIADRDKREGLGLCWPGADKQESLPKVNYAEASAMATGNKIAAIKLYRDRNKGCGLKDAKDVVDAFEKEIKDLNHSSVVDILNNLRRYP